MSSDQQDLPNDTGHAREVWALVSLTVGLVLGPIGLVAGWVLVFTSERWTSPQKVLAALVPVPLFLMFALGGGGVGGYVCTQVDDGPEVCEPHMPVYIAWLGLGALVLVMAVLVVYLNRAARYATWVEEDQVDDSVQA